MMNEEEILTPCTGKCEMNSQTGYCNGCHRTLNEIMAWGMKTQAEREYIMENIVPQRKRQNLSH